MTAAELIVLLRSFPSDAQMVVPDGHNLFHDIVVTYYPDDGVCCAVVAITPKDYWAKEKC